MTRAAHPAPPKPKSCPWCVIRGRVVAECLWCKGTGYV